MGTDEQGQLGQGKVYDRLNPVLSNFGVRKIATSSYNTLFLMWDGTVWACGNNYYNTIQAGSDTGSVKKPIQAKFADGTVITDVVDVAAGDGNVFYVLKDGTVWAVGKNSTGALGDGTTTNRNVPVQVKNADGTYFTNVISADSRRSGAGGNHVVYLKSDGTVWACGRNNEGQLGDGTTTNRRNPVQVIYANGTPMTNAVGVSAGEYHSIYVLGDGSAWSAGKNAHEQLGDNSNDNRSNPVRVKTYIDYKLGNLGGVVSVSAGYYHSAFLKSDGTVWSCGIKMGGSQASITKNSDGSNLSGVVSISAGNNFTNFVKEDGTVWKRTGTYGSSYPEQVSFTGGSSLTGVLGSESSAGSSFYFTNSQAVWATGSNTNGQLGDGTTTNRTSLVRVLKAGPNNLSNLVGVSAGSAFSVFLKGDGTVWATGSNKNGQLGDGSTTDRNPSVQVVDVNGTALSDVVSISAGQGLASAEGTLFILRAMAQPGRLEKITKDNWGMDPPPIVTHRFKWWTPMGLV